MSTWLWNASATTGSALVGFAVGTAVGSSGFSLFSFVEGCGPLYLYCGGLYMGLSGLAVGGALGYAFLSRK